MSTITHISADQITADHTTYIDALQGVVLNTVIGGADDDTVFITVEDANGEHEYRFGLGETVPVLA